MTDLATRPGADEAPVDDVVEAAADDATAPIDGDGQTPPLAWAPAEPAPRKRHLALWLGIPAGIAVVALIASSLVLIAPGTSIAGVPVGGLTPGAAADAVQSQLARTTVVLVGADGDPEVTGAELGATLDARALADRAFGEHPMWNVTTWFADPNSAAVRVDADAATAALSEAAPELFVDPVDATIAFDAAAASYVATPDVPGTGVDVESVRLALQSALAEGTTRVEVDAAPVEIPAMTSTAAANDSVASLNAMLDTVGFYVGDERTVPVERAVAASWLSVAPTGDGAFEITADAAAIQPMVDGLAPLVNRAAEDGRVITNSNGTVLREEAAGISGRELGDTSSVASDFATQLAEGNAVFGLPVTEVEPVIATLARTIEVDLGDQRAYLYENGSLVNSYEISSGLSDSPTPTGRFTVNGYSRVQSMGCFDGAPYCVEDVPWVTWFAPDIGFHGASNLRSSLGYPQSHGCVNMWDDSARLVYEWTALGTEVWVHS
jgi:lipoprotein-anchoring transpeptidase ErfK/SrfK